jgi:hypothetical protein
MQTEKSCRPCQRQPTQKLPPAYTLHWLLTHGNLLFSRVEMFREGFSQQQSVYFHNGMDLAAATPRWCIAQQMLTAANGLQAG